jgi:hypothetical protein
MSCVSTKSPRKGTPTSPILPPTTASFRLDSHLCAFDDIAQPRTLSPANLERTHNHRCYHQKFSSILSNRQNRNVAADFAVVQLLSDTSIQRITHKLKVAQEVDPTSNGIGSNGGHIARMIRARGPLNGNASVRIKKPKYSFNPKQLTKAIKYELDESRTKLILNPEWDHNFNAARSLDPEPLYSHLPDEQSTQHYKHRDKPSERQHSPGGSHSQFSRQSSSGSSARSSNSKVAIEIEVSKILASRGITSPLPDASRVRKQHQYPINTSASTRANSPEDFLNSRGNSRGGSRPGSRMSSNSRPNSRLSSRPDTSQHSVSSSGSVNLFARTLDGGEKYDSAGISHENRRLHQVGVDSYLPKYIDANGEFSPVKKPQKPSSLWSSKNNVDEISVLTGSTRNNFDFTGAGSPSFVEVTRLFDDGEQQRPYTSDGSYSQTGATARTASKAAPAAMSVTSTDGSSHKSRYNPQLFIEENASREKYFNNFDQEKNNTLAIDLNQYYASTTRPSTSAGRTTESKLVSGSALEEADEVNADTNSVTTNSNFDMVVLIDRMDTSLLQLCQTVLHIGSYFGLDDCKFLCNRLIVLSTYNDSQTRSSAPSNSNDINNVSLLHMCYVGLLMGLPPTWEDMMQLFSKRAEAVVAFMQTVLC